MIDRRTFLASAGVLGVGVAIGDIPGGLRASPHGKSATRKTRPPTRKKILILGGTGFIGPPMVRYAVERGHEVTIFTRGRSQVDLPDVERLIGDRADDLSALKGRTWDVVLDNNARDYRWVKLTTELLKDAVEQYIFVSSISAYEGEAIGYEYADEPWSKSPIEIETPLVSKPADFVDGQETSYGLTKALSEALAKEAFPGRTTVVRPGYIETPLISKPADFVDGQEAEYGLTKALSEALSKEAFPGRTTVVRPGYIVGPGDPTDRFTYWPVRIDRGGEILAPGDGSDPMQIIDARDLTEWIVRLAENGTPGTFNGVGPASPMSAAEMLHGIRAITSSQVSFTWVPTTFLKKLEVMPYSDMPIWTPGDPFAAVDHSHAIASGLTFRSLAETSLDTLKWHRTRPVEAQAELQTGIKPGRERQVLDAWHRSK